MKLDAKVLLTTLWRFYLHRAETTEEVQVPSASLQLKAYDVTFYTTWRICELVVNKKN